jgi:hypothetical protein
MLTPLGHTSRSIVMSLVESFVEVDLPNPENFLKVKETLTPYRGIIRQKHKLRQSCHILHKRGKYYIVHFKELFMLDGLPANFPRFGQGSAVIPSAISCRSGV